MACQFSIGPGGPISAIGSHPSGLVTTLAGNAGNPGASDGMGQAALFYAPEGVASAGSTLYVADTQNSLIRKIDLYTGRVSTIAGYPGTTGSADGIGTGALFYHPGNLALDTTSGNLYISDTGNNTVRQLQLSNNVVVTIAGTPGAPGAADGIGSAARFNHPRGLAFDATHACLYVADTYNQTIRSIALPGTALPCTVTTVAGGVGVSGSLDGTGTAARFSDPWDIALSTTGDLYVADSANDTIRDIAIATWSISTLAGNAGQTGSQDGTGSAARFDDPRGIATDGTNIYVGDMLNDVIRKIGIASKLTSTLAGRADIAASCDGLGSSALFNRPTSITVGIDSQSLQTCLFIADTSNETIREVIP
jgi:sugar lactone lactonase YvrE